LSVGANYRTMTFVVPFDNSELATAALERAVGFAELTGETVVAVTVIPRNNVSFARERGLLEADEAFDLETVLGRLRERVAAVDSSVGFDYRDVDRYAPSGTVANRLKAMARQHDASVVFVGSDNAGRFVASLGSVGRSVASGTAYDVYVVRSPSPPSIARP
jgi:nucleotide-binding universal stress UspA family protein